MGAAQKSTHRVRRLPPADLGDGGTILHASKLPLTVWFWAAYLMATHSNGISALQLQKQLRYRLLPQLLGCSPTSCAPAWSTPSATRCRAWWKSTRPAFHSGPKTNRRARGHDGKMLTELGDGNIPGRLRLAEISSYGGDLGIETAADPDAIAKTTAGPATLRSPQSPQCPCRRENRRSPRPAVDPPSLLQPQRMGARRLPRAASQASQAYLDEFVFRFNRRKTRYAAFRSLFRIATNAEPLTYSMLIEPEPCA